MKVVNLIYILILTILLNTDIYGYSYLSIERGDIVGYYGTRSLGMGGTFIAGAKDSSAMLGNPACGVNFPLLGVKAGLNYLFGGERVAEFEGQETGESSFSKFNFHSFGIYTRPAEIISIGINYQPFIDFNYESEYKYPLTSAEPTEIRKIVSEGVVNAISFGISINLSFISAGFSYSLLKGSQTLEQSINYMNISLPDKESTEEYDYSGGIISAGLLGEPVNNFYLGFFIRPGGTLERKGENSTRSAKLPMVIGGGLVYQDLKKFDTEFSLDIVYNMWENYKESNTYGSITTSEVTPAGFHSTVDIRVGVEHIVVRRKTKIPVRLGYYFQPFYGNDAYDYSVFTFGIGYYPFFINNLYFDFSAEFGKRNYIGDSHYYSSDLLIDETLFNTVVSLKYEIK